MIPTTLKELGERGWKFSGSLGKDGVYRLLVIALPNFSIDTIFTDEFIRWVHRDSEVPFRQECGSDCHQFTRAFYLQMQRIRDMIAPVEPGHAHEVFLSQELKNRLYKEIRGFACIECRDTRKVLQEFARDDIRTVNCVCTPKD